MGIKLNLAAGKRPKEGYINIDINPQIDGITYGDALELNYEDNVAEEIISEHFIEHLTKPELDLFFIECKRLLVAGGKLILIAPSIESSIKKYIEGKQTIEHVENLMCGRHLSKYDFHKQGIYKEKLERLCAKYKFKVIKIYYQDRSSLGCAADEIVLEAVKNA